MTTYFEMAQAARTMSAENRARMALCLLRIYEADRTQNNGLVTGEANLCSAFAAEARYLLSQAGVLTGDAASCEREEDPERYNGWTNRETWALKLHLDNTEGSQAWLIETARLAGENAEASEVWTLEQAKVFTTEDAIKNAVEGVWSEALNPEFTQDGFASVRTCGYEIGLHDPADVLRMIADVGSLWRVNFREIATHVVEEAKEAAAFEARVSE